MAASPSSLLVEKLAPGEFALAEGEQWIGTQFWLVRKERFERFPVAVRRIEERIWKAQGKAAIDLAAESVLKRVFRPPLEEFTLGERYETEYATKVGGYAGVPVYRLLGSDGEFLPFLLNAEVADALVKVTPDCVWLADGKGGAARVDDNVPWAVLMMIRQKQPTA